MTPVVAEGIKAVFARMQEGYARRDAAVIAADYAEDCVVESPIAGVHVGPAAVERELRGIFSAFPDMRVHWDELLISGNRAASIGRTEGTDTGGLMGLPPTGKPFSVSVVMLYTFGNDCKIVHERRMYDFSRLLLHLTEGSEPAAEGPRLYRELLERAQHEQELNLAGEIQRALLPQSEYRAPGFEVVASSVPCRAIGGDFFDYFTLSEGAFALVLGDVTGKGPAAALLAAVLQGIFTANAPRSLTPAIVLLRPMTRSCAGRSEHALPRFSMPCSPLTAAWRIAMQGTMPRSFSGSRDETAGKRRALHWSLRASNVRRGNAATRAGRSACGFQ